ncbi:MAG: hypothetical protein MUO72_04030 [Bacteroidales bacterium]|nr:hypothetical protein [Bacteroidales bacterium]
MKAYLLRLQKLVSPVFTNYKFYLIFVIVIFILSLFSVLFRLELQSFISNWDKPDISVRSYSKSLAYSYYLLFEKRFLILLTLLPLSVTLYLLSGFISISFDFLTDLFLFSTPQTFLNYSNSFEEKYKNRFKRIIIITSIGVVLIACAGFLLINSIRDISIAQFTGFIWKYLFWIVIAQFTINTLFMFSLRKDNPKMFDYFFFSDLSLRRHFTGIMKFLFITGAAIILIFHSYIPVIVDLSNSTVRSETSRFSNFCASLNRSIRVQSNNEKNIALDPKFFNELILKENEIQSSLISTVNTKILSEKIFHISLGFFLVQFLIVIIGRYIKNKSYLKHLKKIGISALKSFCTPIIIFFIIKFLYKIDIANPFSTGIVLSFIITLIFIIEDSRINRSLNKKPK